LQRPDRHPALQPIDARVKPALIVVCTRKHDPRADELELQPGRGRTAHLSETRVDDVGGPRQLA
jgi:hypothetical protein